LGWKRGHIVRTLAAALVPSSRFQGCAVFIRYRRKTTLHLTCVVRSIPLLDSGLLIDCHLRHSERVFCELQVLVSLINPFACFPFRDRPPVRCRTTYITAISRFTHSLSARLPNGSITALSTRGSKRNIRIRTSSVAGQPRDIELKMGREALRENAYVRNSAFC
jgi:hypothetical protein